VREREIELVETCRDSPLLARVATSVDTLIPQDARVLLVPDRVSAHEIHHLILIALM
jgi:hypothetical protein